MKIYFAENNSSNELIVVEDNKAIVYSQDNGILIGTNIDLYETDLEGTLQREKIVNSLKKYLSETMLNDFQDIGEIYFNWNPEDFERTTQVY